MQDGQLLEARHAELSPFTMNRQNQTEDLGRRFGIRSLLRRTTRQTLYWSANIFSFKPESISRHAHCASHGAITWGMQRRWCMAVELQCWWALNQHLSYLSISRNRAAQMITRQQPALQCSTELLSHLRTKTLRNYER
jgi:hypothetical protein